MLGLADADTAENQSTSKNVVITPVACALPGKSSGEPKLSGQEALRVVRDSRLFGIVGQEEIPGEFFCNFAVNGCYERRFAEAGLRVSARDRAGEMRAVELPNHRFFHAMLFQPQLSSSAQQPHPVIAAYINACAEFRRERRRPAMLI